MFKFDTFERSFSGVCDMPVTTHKFQLKTKIDLKAACLGLLYFFVCIYKTVTFTSTCSFHSLCLMQFPPMEVLKGVDRFLSFHRSINHDPESWWRCNCGHGFHHQVVLPAILSLSNIRQNSTRSCEKPGRVVSLSYCDGVWWNSSVFFLFSQVFHMTVWKWWRPSYIETHLLKQYERKNSLKKWHRTWEWYIWTFDWTTGICGEALTVSFGW